MDDDLVPPQSDPPLRGNSRGYLLQRLERDGHHELLAAIDAKMLTVYAAACEVGYVTRPEPTGRGSPNAAKRREWAIRKAFQGSARADAASITAQAPTDALRLPPNGRSGPSTPIDLAAVIAEWEEAQKPAPPREALKSREPTPAAIPPGAERISFPAHAAIPCTRCERPQAAAALREILDVYVAARRGEPHQTGNVLPSACCQRLLLRRPDIRAMIA